MAISGDDDETLREYKKSLGASFPFIADPNGELMELYDVKYPLFTMSGRYSFVVGTGRRVIKVFSGSDAIDAQATLNACGRPPKSKEIEAATEYDEKSKPVESP